MKKLSILIPSLPDPDSQNYLSRLMAVLNAQVNENIEILVNDSPRTIPTGLKRNALINQAQGEYISQIDCDDLVPVYYVREALNAIESNPDVITFKGFMTTNNITRKDFTIKLGEGYEERDNHYYRYPNHLCIFKRELVKNIQFRPIWQQEDYFWATEVRDKGILKSEVHIDKVMYHYDYRTKYSNAVRIMQSRVKK